MIKMFRKILPITLVSLFLIMCFAEISVAAEAKFDSWTMVAEAMNECLVRAKAAYQDGQPDEARDLVNEAYFQFYEKEGFERNVKSRVSGKRASQVEYRFATIKGKIKDGAAVSEVIEEIDILESWLLEDAQNLDGPKVAAEAGFESQTASQITDSQETSKNRGWVVFMAAFGTLVREGFEAILVIAAIAAYLSRSGNQKSITVVYKSAVFAVVVSILAAIGLQYVFDISGAKQEILEGATMLLATVVLFFVSNWMFSKAEAEAWKSYIDDKVKTAVTKGSAWALGAAAFLAVFREGAETILFYQGILSEAGESTFMVWAGFALGCVALVIIFIIIRHGTMKLPLKPFFIGTSILMYIMAIAFAGGGIKELQEGDLIGTTMLQHMPTIDILGVYPTVQTMIPQAILIILVAVSIFYYRQKKGRLQSV